MNQTVRFSVRDVSVTENPIFSTDAEMIKCFISYNFTTYETFRVL